MTYNYHADIVWAIDIALIGVLFFTCIVIFLSVLYKEHVWQKRRRGLLKLKKNVYEMVLASEDVPGSVCLPSISDITPQQYIDIETDRNIYATFFNEAEQKFFRACFIRPENTGRLADVVKKSHDKWKKIEAMLCLGYIGAQHAADILKGLIFSKDNDIVYFSILSLGQIRTVESGRVLLSYLRKVPASGYKIVAILESFPPELAEDVAGLINYHDTMVRFWALTLLTKFAAPRYIKKVEMLTHDQSPEVRAVACDCLGAAKSEEVVPALTRCLKDVNWLVKCHAIAALSKLMKAASVPKVIGLINDASWSVVDAVKNVMAEHIDASIPYIEKFLYSEDEVPKKYSVLALQGSGRLSKLVYDAAAGKADSAEIKVLKGVVNSGIHGGLDDALNELEPGLRSKALDTIMKMREA